MSFYTQMASKQAHSIKQGRQEERQAALPLHSCFGSLISCYCCSVGIILPLLLHSNRALPLQSTTFLCPLPFPSCQVPYFQKARIAAFQLGGQPAGGPQVRWRGAPQLFPSDLYYIIVLILIVIGAEAHLSNLMRVKWRHLGPEEAASGVACMWGHVAWVDRHAP